MPEHAQHEAEARQYRHYPLPACADLAHLSTSNAVRSMLTRHTPVSAAGVSSASLASRHWSSGVAVRVGFVSARLRFPKQLAIIPAS